MATILLAGVDLSLRAQLETLLPGHHLTTTDNIDPPDVVIADIGRIDPGEVSDAYPETPIIGFSGHLDAAAQRVAFEAGFDRVVARSVMLESVGELISELVSS